MDTYFTELNYSVVAKSGWYPRHPRFHAYKRLQNVRVFSQKQNTRYNEQRCDKNDNKLSESEKEQCENQTVGSAVVLLT